MINPFKNNWIWIFKYNLNILPPCLCVYIFFSINKTVCLVLILARNTIWYSQRRKWHKKQLSLQLFKMFLKTVIKIIDGLSLRSNGVFFFFPIPDSIHFLYYRRILKVHLFLTDTPFSVFFVISITKTCRRSH